MNKEYKFGGGFLINVRVEPAGAFYSMGEANIYEEKVYELHYKGKQLGEYETYIEACARMNEEIDLPY